MELHSRPSEILDEMLRSNHRIRNVFHAIHSNEPKKDRSLRHEFGRYIEYYWRDEWFRGVFNEFPEIPKQSGTNLISMDFSKFPGELPAALNNAVYLFQGAVFSSDELTTVSKHFGNRVPPWFWDLLSKVPVAGSMFALKKDQDLSGFGVEMQWMDGRDMITESSEMYPGMIAVQHGYIPCGNCLKGSGDPYFLKWDANSGDPAVFRIPHESVRANDTFIEGEIDLVSKTLSDFLNKAATVA